MASFFKRREELKKQMEKIEEQYKDAEPPELEKGDKLAIFIAAIMAFAPFLLLMFGILALAFLLE